MAGNSRRSGTAVAYLSLLFLVCCACSAAWTHAGTTSTASAGRWSDAVAAEIRQTEQLLAEWRTLHTSLQQAGMPGPSNEDAYLAWARQADPKLIHDTTRLYSLEMDLPSRLMHLWFVTGAPTIIPGVARDELLRHGDEILGAYRKLLAERGAQPIEELLRESLPDTIKAMHSAYAPVASRVMEYHILFSERRMRSDGRFSPSTATEAEQQWYSRVWERWYAQHAAELTWSSEYSEFVRPGGGPFDTPPTEDTTGSTTPTR